VSAAESQGIPLADIVPVYQAFGGGGFSSWILPTAAQEQIIISIWGSLVPIPAFDYAYSWSVQSQIIGDTLDAPYINLLAAGGALLSNYTAITHPSEPNYFALYAGSFFGVTDDNFHSEPDPGTCQRL
jgi:hypothetical protein